MGNHELSQLRLNNAVQEPIDHSQSQSDKQTNKGALSAAKKAAIEATRTGLDVTGQALSLAAGTVGASLSSLNNINVDPQLISRVTSATKNHGVAARDLLGKLPGELEQMGTATVDEDGILYTDLNAGIAHLTSLILVLE